MPNRELLRPSSQGKDLVFLDADFPPLFRYKNWILLQLQNI